jgi:hypothetical protein
MTALAALADPNTHLPQLSGRWVSAYRTLWGSLAFVAAILTAIGLYMGLANPAVEALRVLKTVVLVSVCAILFRRRATDPVAALLSLAFLMWAITSSMDFASAGILTAIGDRVRFLLFALAMLLFPDGSWRPGWTRLVALASLAVCLLGVGEGAGLSPTHVFLPLAILCILAAVAGLIARFRSAASEAVRQQLKWVALGLVSGIGSILAARAGASFTPASAGAGWAIVWEGLFQLGIILIALGFLISLLRYRLFDAETAITRSASYAALTVALVITFAGTEAAIEWFGQQYLGMSIGNLAAAVGAAVAAATLGPLHHRISDWAEQRFQRDLVELKTELPELLTNLSNWSSLHEIGRIALSRIAQGTHATWAGLTVDGRIVATEGSPGSSSSATRIALQLPARMCGEIVLGPRPDGSAQAGDEIDALETIVPALSKAIWVATYRDRQLKRELRFKRSVSKRIAALSERIGQFG